MDHEHRIKRRMRVLNALLAIVFFVMGYISVFGVKHMIERDRTVRSHGLNQYRCR